MEWYIGAGVGHRGLRRRAFLRLTMFRFYAARLLATASAALAVAVPLVGGILVPAHSHVENFISELGSVGTQWDAAMSFGGFLPIGMSTLAFLIVAAPLLGLKAAGRSGTG